MNYKLPQLQSEADVINLIGYNTPMKFNYTSEGTFEFETLIPKSYSNIDLFTYVVEFFIEEGRSPEFFMYDSFSDFLSDYQIHSVKLSFKSDESDKEIYSKPYESSTEVKQTRLGFFLDSQGIRKNFEDNVNNFGDLSLNELYNLDLSLSQAIAYAFPFKKTPEGEGKWNEVVELSKNY